MIESLTEAQTLAMPAYVTKWIAVGMDTQPTDQSAASAAVIAMYENGGLAAPQRILFADGPQAGFDLYKSLGGSTANNFLNGMMFGNHEAYWLAVYDYFHTEVGVQNLEKIFPLLQVARTCGWVYCARDTAIVMSKPEFIHMDEERRLHCETGPAIRYPDGFCVYAWHGVRVPGDWIDDRAALTAQRALAVENMEQRRAACEMVGWVNIIDQLQGVVIDQDEDAQIGTLVRVNIPDVGTEQFLRVRCGTGREFALPVPPDVRTALAANAWTYDIEPDVLRMLEVRT
jgi:hypothetical protein